MCLALDPAIAAKAPEGYKVPQDCSVLTMAAAEEVYRSACFISQKCIIGESVTPSVVIFCLLVSHLQLTKLHTDLHTRADLDWQGNMCAVTAAQSKLHWVLHPSEHACMIFRFLSCM